ncbi:hypothetical protein ACLB2K_069548 [Fragaria x ananassa]
MYSTITPNVMASTLETKPHIVLDDERKQEEESFHYAVQLVVSSALPMSMQLAIEDSSVLTTHSILGCSVVDGQRLYSLSAVSKHFVTNEDGISLGSVMALFQDMVFINSWSKLKYAVVEGGIPFDRFHGMPSFEYSGLNPRFNQVFNAAMFNHTTVVMKRILQLGQLVDVGGGLAWE